MQNAMAKRSRMEQYLRANSDRTDAQERISLILRGPALGIPLWVPKRLKPCSKCLRLVNFQKFHLRTPNPRIEPICDDCYEQMKRPRNVR